MFTGEASKELKVGEKGGLGRGGREGGRGGMKEGEKKGGKGLNWRHYALRVWCVCVCVCVC